MSEERTLFCDESGTNKNDACYSIGALSIPHSKLPNFNSVMSSLASQHGIQSEVKWEKVRNSHGLINFGLDCLKRTIPGSPQLSVIVVHKGKYRKWSEGDREEAFYTTYSLLLKGLLSSKDHSAEVLLDDRNDSYPKQEEVLQIVTGNMLRQIGSATDISSLTKEDSRKHWGLQLVDLIAGAVDCAHNLYLNPSAQVSPGKLLFIERFSSILGWDRLVYDTYPNSEFNIWHFPSEYRADPESRHIDFDSSVPFVTAEDLRLAREGI